MFQKLHLRKTSDCYARVIPTAKQSYIQIANKIDYLFFYYNPVMGSQRF